MKRLTLFLALLTLLPLACEAQEPAPAPQPAVVPNYPDSPDGLKRLVTVMVEATKNNDQKTLAAYAQSLRLPNPEAWFKDVFGEVPGTQIAASHESLRNRLQAALFEALSAVLRDQFADLKILRFEKSCEPATDAMFYSTLLLRLRHVTFYMGQFTKPGDSRDRSTGFFAYVDGAFRYLGVIGVESLRAPPTSKVIRQGGIVQQAKLVSQVRPHYPSAARDNRIQGRVRLMALINTDGAIGALQVIDGSCVLAEEAVKTVRQWRYSPTLLNVEPVVVVTTVDVIFTLGR